MACVRSSHPAHPVPGRSVALVTSGRRCDTRRKARDGRRKQQYTSFALAFRLSSTVFPFCFALPDVFHTPYTGRMAQDQPIRLDLGLKPLHGLLLAATVTHALMLSA